MIRAAIFDIGGVLLHSRNVEATRARWEKRLGLTEGELWRVLPGIVARADSGELDEEAFWAEIAEALGAEGVIQELRDDAWWWDEVDAELVSFIASLRPQILTGIISNAYAGAREFADRRHGLIAHFDTVVISGEEGCVKPDERIYRIACERLGVEPAEAVFVDDLRVNVEAARTLGMQGIQHRDTAETIAKLAELLR